LTNTAVLEKFGLDPKTSPMKPMSVEQCVSEGLRGLLRKNRSRIVPGRLNRIMNALVAAEAVTGLGGHHEFPTPDRHQIVHTHQTANLLRADYEPLSLKECRDSAVAVMRCASAARRIVSRTAISAAVGFCRQVQ
jgi:hypothetical protein